LLTRSIQFLVFFALFPILLLAQSWAEKTLSELTLDQKIGQLFMPPACPLREEDHRRDWAVLVEKHHIGNAILKHSDPLTQIKFLNDLQSGSNIPLLIAADAEWGLAMRMKQTIAFPKNQTLGAMGDLDLIFQVGAEIGRQAKQVGIHLNLAPVADVNTNPANPVIGMRAFGEDPIQVAACVAAMVRGMQSAGILTCAKHFPGHGDTSVDSHHALPLVPHARDRLETVEFVPFRRAIQEGVDAIMSAHLLVPAIDSERPSTLSFACLTGILREELGFGGLIVSDALNMKALADTPEEIAVGAFQAGCDLLLYGDHFDPNIDKILKEDVPRAWKALKRQFEDGTLSEERLNGSVAKILRAKERLGLHLTTKLSEEGIAASLHSEEAVRLKKRLFKEAVVLRGDPSSLLPKKTAYLIIGGPDEMSKAFSAVFSAAPDLDLAERIRLSDQLKDFDAVAIAVHQFGPRERNYGFSPDCIDLIRSLPKSILCLFGTPYALSLFSHPGPLLIGFENDPDAQEAVLSILQRQNVLLDLLRN